MTVESMAAEPRPAPRPLGPQYYLLAIGLALVGGLLGIIGAFFAESRAVASPQLFMLAPPIAEEVLKPVGIYVLLFRWPQVVRGQLSIAGLAALSGLTFGLVESTVYATLYVSDPSDTFLIVRFTVPVFMHTVASFIAGWGINARLLGWATGDNPFPKASLGPFLTAMTLHASYNVIVVVLAIVGILDFD